MPQNEPVQTNQSGGPSLSVTSHNQSGGITAGTVHLAPPRRDLNQLPELQADILAAVDKARPLSILAISGDSEAYDLAVQISYFLSDKGYKVGRGEGAVGSFSGGVKPAPVTLTDMNGHPHLLVGRRD